MSRADTLLHDNGADLYTSSSLDSINHLNKITDDFTLSSAATLQRVVFGEYTLHVGTTAPIPTPVAVDWCIGGSQFSTSVGCGTATLAATATGIVLGSLTNYSSTFTLPDLPLVAGTYWLTLGNGTDTQLNNTYWSISATSGNAQNFFSNTSAITNVNNEASFQIYGAVGAGEPEMPYLIGFGLASCAALLGRRRIVWSDVPG